MTEFTAPAQTPEQLADQLLDTLYNHTGRRPRHNGGNRYMANCPHHEDRKTSLAVTVGDKGIVLYCHAGCTSQAIMADLGLHWGNLFFKPLERRTNGSGNNWMPCFKSRGHKQKVAEYLYRNSSGTIIYGVARCEAKCFAQWRPLPTGKRRWSLYEDDRITLAVELVPYRLPEILAELRTEFPSNVWIVEGEKDADRLWSRGYPATCNSGGAGKWTPEHAKWLAGADVMVVADRDTAGENHAINVVNTLMPIARSIEVVQAGVNIKGADISDHLDAGLRLYAPDLIRVAEPLPAPAIGLDGMDLPREATP